MKYGTMDNMLDKPEMLQLEEWTNREGLSYIVGKLIDITRKKAKLTSERRDWKEHHTLANNLVALLSIQNKLK